MKSLEIVDSNIKSIVDYLDNPQVKEDIDCLNIMCVGVSYKELQQIKQDLEVLEIIKKIFEKANFHFYPNGYEADILLEDNDICIEAIDRITKLKVADVKRLKQWLDENDEKEN